MGSIKLAFDIIFKKKYGAIYTKKQRFILWYQLSIFGRIKHNYDQWRFRGTKNYLRVTYGSMKINWALRMRKIGCWIDGHHKTNMIMTGYETCGYRCGYKRKLTQEELDEDLQY